MSLVRAITRPGMRGLGAAGYADTGDGITPENFQDQCCIALLGLNPLSAECLKWGNANSALFGGNNPCSSKAQEALDLAALGVPDTPPVLSPPDIDTAGGSTDVNPSYGQAMTKNNQPVASAADANDLIVQLIAAQTAQERAQVRAFMKTQAVTQCGKQAVICAGNTFFRKVSPDCTGCDLDLSNSELWLAVFGITVATVLVVKIL